MLLLQVGANKNQCFVEFASIDQALSIVNHYAVRACWCISVHALVRCWLRSVVALHPDLAGGVDGPFHISSSSHFFVPMQSSANPASFRGRPTWLSYRCAGVCCWYGRWLLRTTCDVCVAAALPC